jgi:hypothetical protein
LECCGSSSFVAVIREEGNWSKITVSGKAIHSCCKGISSIELIFSNFILAENVFSGELATGTTKVDSRKGLHLVSNRRKDQCRVMLPVRLGKAPK